MITFSISVQVTIRSVIADIFTFHICGSFLVH
jgi:hypothetical protein